MRPTLCREWMPLLLSLLRRCSFVFFGWHRPTQDWSQLAWPLCSPTQLLIGQSWPDGIMASPAVLPQVYKGRAARTICNSYTVQPNPSPCLRKGCQEVQQGPQAGAPRHCVSSKAMSIMNSFVNNLFSCIAGEASKLAHYNKRSTICCQSGANS